MKRILAAAALLALSLPAWAEALDIVSSIQRAGVPPWLTTVLIATLPIFELRGAIPVGNRVLGLSLPQAAGYSILGNMLPIIPILLLLGPVSRWLSQIEIFRRFFTWLFARTRSRSELVRRYELIGLMLFVAVPLPMTGAWTGAVAAFLFGIGFWPSLGAIFLGVLIAATIVSTLVWLGIWGALIAGLVLSLLAASALWNAVRTRRI